jgi:hypothetical protein
MERVAGVRSPDDRGAPESVCVHYLFPQVIHRNPAIRSHARSAVRASDRAPPLETKRKGRAGERVDVLLLAHVPIAGTARADPPLPPRVQRGSSQYPPPELQRTGASVRALAVPTSNASRYGRGATPAARCVPRIAPLRWKPSAKGGPASGSMFFFSRRFQQPEPPAPTLPFPQEFSEGPRSILPQSCSAPGQACVHYLFEQVMH